MSRASERRAKHHTRGEKDDWPAVDDFPMLFRPAGYYEERKAQSLRPRPNPTIQETRPAPGEWQEVQVVSRAQARRSALTSLNVPVPVGPPPSSPDLDPPDIVPCVDTKRFNRGQLDEPRPKPVRPGRPTASASAW
jgi:hypothetical protein